MSIPTSSLAPYARDTETLAVSVRVAGPPDPGCSGSSRPSGGDGASPQRGMIFKGSGGGLRGTQGVEKISIPLPSPFGGSGLAGQASGGSHGSLRTRPRG